MNFDPTSVLKDFQTFFPMMWAILRGKYKMPWGTFFWAIICLVYLISPIDLLPDVLPLLGITDDGAFALLILAMLHKDLAAYRQAQLDKENIIEAEVIESKNKEP